MADRQRGSLQMMRSGGCCRGHRDGNCRSSARSIEGVIMTMGTTEGLDHVSEVDWSFGWVQRDRRRVEWGRTMTTRATIAVEKATDDVGGKSKVGGEGRAWVEAANEE